jgi:hypothetical protein
MAFDLGVDRLPRVLVAAGGLFAQANKADDGSRPIRFVRLGKLVVVAPGFLEP